jgi:hypothetical protein
LEEKVLYFRSQRSDEMLRSGRFAVILGLAGAVWLPSMAVAQNDSDVAAAIRFQKAEDAAAARQARIDARGGANSADRLAQPPDSKSTPSASAQKETGVEAAIRFQRAEDAAAARQAHLEAADADENSADRMAVAPAVKSKTVKSAAARKNPPSQHQPQ